VECDFSAHILKSENTSLIPTGKFKVPLPFRSQDELKSRI
jgi:hypothetical protein